MAGRAAAPAARGLPAQAAAGRGRRPALDPEKTRTRIPQGRKRDPRLCGTLAPGVAGQADRRLHRLLRPHFPAGEKGSRRLAAVQRRPEPPLPHHFGDHRRYRNRLDEKRRPGLFPPVVRIRPLPRRRPQDPLPGLRRRGLADNQGSVDRRQEKRTPKETMTRTTHILAPLLLLLLLVSSQSAWGQIRHEVFLANTDHELHVYRITGQEPGPTLMIIGGIQGDEPGSYLTADLYADIHLKRGNLIVVPRANLYSILLNRRNGLTGDMNRKFDDKVEKRNLEEEVVAILKHLIAESDCLLNLHEGSGFYNPKWINDMENPMRFGQSIIFDAAEYRVPGEERIIRLAEMADRIISRVNPQIDNPRYRFRPNNHDTLNPNTSHPEQRKSATYYALTRANIPAFGVETSKSIRSLATKIQLHKLVINAVMADLGIILDTPGVNLEPPQLRYLLVQVGNGFPYALPDGARLEVAEGTDITVTDIIANYRRGLVADIEGLGSTNDNHKPFRITEPTRIIVRKDAQRCGLVEVVPRRPAAIEPAAPKAAAAARP
ncbi:MAG TPA: hypothetical protein ENJ73_00495, partial [Desulfobacterales bacterium]|nr:hypothetical protein [Desulfobacterales bacterium]